MADEDVPGVRRVELNPGEIFALAPNTLLVSQYDLIIANTAKIGLPEGKQLSWLVTFQGRLNNSYELASFTAVLALEDFPAFAVAVEKQLNWLYVKFIEPITKKRNAKNPNGRTRQGKRK